MEKIPVLDHGYVQLIDAWGSDESVIEAARMSTDGAFVSWEPYEGHPSGDMGLLRTLMKKGHTSPFEMIGATIEVQAPIAVFREWHRHRTMSYNEHSARYSPLPALDYVPSLDRLLTPPDARNKQAGALKGSVQLEHDCATSFQRSLRNLYQQAEDLYQAALSAGVPKELARLCLPVGRYSKMRASANLLNWFRFLSKRLPTDAQWEIRRYAEVTAHLLQQKFPRCWEVFTLNFTSIQRVETVMEK